MSEKVFSKQGPKDGAAPRNLLKRLGLLSGIMWVAAMGAVYALKDMGGTPAGVHGQDEPEAADDEAGELADVPASADSEEPGRAPAHAHRPDPGHPHGTSDASEQVSPENGEAAVRRDDAEVREAGETAEGDGEEAEEAGDEPAAANTTLDEREALRQLAEIHAGRGDLEKALPPLRKLMTAPTQDVALLSLATEVFLGTGNYREAMVSARKALRHAPPGRVDLQVSAIMAQFRLGQVAGAFEAAEAALKDNPRDLDLLTALGTMEIEMGPAHPGYGEAIGKALKIEPGHVPALYQAGRKAQLEGDYKDAEILFRKVLKREPRHAKARGQLGTALYHLRKDREARREFEAALALSPGDYNTWFNLGELHLAQAAREKAPGRIRNLRAQAMSCYLKAVEWNPDHAQAHYRAGVLLNGNRQFKEAIRHLEASRQADSRHVPTLVQLAVAYENLKRPERAKGFLEKAFQLDPLDKLVLFKLKRMAQAGT